MTVLLKMLRKCVLKFNFFDFLPFGGYVSGAFSFKEPFNSRFLGTA